MGFATNQKDCYLVLKTNAELDATTVKKENFKISTVGNNLSTVDKVRYLPMYDEIRLYVKDAPDFIYSPEFSIVSSGVKDTNGKSASISQKAYLMSDELYELYDVSIVRISYTKDGMTLYKQPNEGNYTAKITIVNTSPDIKNITLSVSAVDGIGNVREIKTDALTLNPDEMLESSCAVNIASGEKICVSMNEN